MPTFKELFTTAGGLGMVAAITAVVAGVVVAGLALPPHCPGTTNMIGCSEWATWGGVAPQNAPYWYGALAGAAAFVIGMLVKPRG